MTDDPDQEAALEAARAIIMQCMVQRLIQDGATPEEAQEGALKLWSAPRPDAWPPLPTFEEL